MHLLHHSIVHGGKRGLGHSLCHIVPVSLRIGERDRVSVEESGGQGVSVWSAEGQGECVEGSA